jgi:hypothetical protein
MHLTGKNAKGFAVQKKLISRNGEATLRKSWSSANEQSTGQYCKQQAYWTSHESVSTCHQKVKMTEKRLAEK